VRVREDPVVKLKEQELQIRAANDQMDNQVDQARLQIEQPEGSRDGPSQ
jgi:flagellar biosynthesis protein FlhB